MSGSTPGAVGVPPSRPAAPYEARVQRQLLQWGLSLQGLQQLTQGRMPSAPHDRRLIAAIVARAAGSGRISVAGPAAHETLVHAWVLWRLGLHSEAGRAAARLAQALQAGWPDDDEPDLLLAGVVHVLRAVGREDAARDLFQAHHRQPAESPDA